MEGAEDTIHRALALRHLELPVGDFIKDAIEKDVPLAARELLLSNIKDEENHDLALVCRYYCRASLEYGKRDRLV